MSAPDVFDEHLARWRDWCASPWGRLRFAVAHETLGRHLASLGAGPLRVLDVGGGDARDSLPLAIAGHDVTVVDTAPGMLGAADRRATEAGVPLRTVRAGLDDLAGLGDGFDLVLCHFVLHYRPAAEPDLARLAAAVRPGGLLSVMAPNPAGVVLQKLVRGGPSAALEELASDRWHTVTFAEDGRKYSREECATEMAACGLEVLDWYGGRCANDLLTDDEAKRDPDYFATLERLELQLCDREPFRRIGLFWQQLGRRPSVSGVAPESARR